MRRLKWFFTMVVLFLSLLFGSIGTASAKEYVSISDIREEVQDGWHETYEFNGKTIIVDIGINVPDVDKFPVIQVERVSGIEPHSDDVTVISSDSDGIVIEKRSSEDAFWYGLGEAYCYLEPFAQADNSPMIAYEASDFLRSVALEYQSQYGSFGLEVKPVTTFSREYAVIRDKNGEKIGTDTDKPMTEMGCYSVWFYQTFHGIPVLEGGIMGGPENFRVDVLGPV